MFDKEIAAIEVKSRKGPVSFAKDEHNRPQTTKESLAKLAPVFKKEGGTVTAGNASGISDGAGAIILASAEACEKHGLTPLARVVGWGIAGVDPKGKPLLFQSLFLIFALSLSICSCLVMGIGPVPAIQQLLQKTNKSLKDIDLIEVNEAFASQFLAVEKDLSLPREKTNINGGAIACGHPTGASGSRILSHLTYELHRHNQKLAIGSACIGGGQGIAVLLEKV